MYAEADRLIYTYKIEGEEAGRRLDPMAVMARFMEAASVSGQDAGRLFEQIDGPENVPPDQVVVLRLRALQKLAPLAAKAMKLPLFNEETGEGYPMAVVVEAFNDYLGWRNDVKKNSAVTPSGSSPGDGPPVASGPEGVD